MEKASIAQNKKSVEQTENNCHCACDCQCTNEQADNCQCGTNCQCNCTKNCC